MDKFWIDAKVSVEALMSVQTVYGPAGMAIPGIKSYDELGTTLEKDAVLILHKGQFSAFDAITLDTVRQTARPVFANEVFVVFAGANVICGEKTIVDSDIISDCNKKIDALVLFGQQRPSVKYNSLQKDVIQIISGMVEHTNKNGEPNINALWMIIKDLNAIKWSVKQQGYALAQAIYRELCQRNVPPEPGLVPLDSKPSTQADIESGWFLYWMAELMTAPLPHRKLWEFGWILQNLHAHGLLKEGKSALGFGCGEEPLPSYFASRGLSVTVTDLAPDAVAGMGWAETGQHTGTLNSAWKENLVSKDIFNRNVSLEYVDMNKIPQKMSGQYDFCWSVCALEHLGSIDNGLAFIENSLKTLKPGGVALHTTEFNYTEIDKTIDNHSTVLFLQKHFIELKAKLESDGHRVAPLNFDVGNDPLDNFIDVPPYEFAEFLEYRPGAKGSPHRRGHLKLSVDGFPSTCFGFKVQKHDDANN